MRKSIRSISLLAVAMILFASFTFGQETTGNIDGLVVDQTDAVIPGATVVVTGINRGFRRTITTSADGSFLLVQVPQGRYRLEVSMSGFVTKTGEVQVSLGQTATVNLKLQASAGVQTVDITGSEIAAIDVENNKIQTNINARRTELTPKANLNFSGVLRVSPAVRPEPLAAGFQIDGSSGAENTFIVDGLEVTNFRTGQLRGVANIANAAVSEVQVKTSGFEAEYGGATGGVVNVVSKGGDNDFHGTFGIQFESDALDSNTRPLLRGVSDRTEFITPSSGGSTFLNPPDTEYTNYFPEASLGGPILKDRVWFFVSGAPQFRNRTRVSVFPDGSTETNTSDTRNDYYFARVDGQPVDKIRAYATYSYTPQLVDGNLLGFGAGGSTGNLRPLGGRVNNVNWTYGVTITPTSNTVISARGGRSFLNEKDGAYGVSGAPAVGCRGSQAVLDMFPNFGCPNGQIGDLSPLVFNTVKDVSVRDTFDVDGTYILNSSGAGRHIIKGGYQLNRIVNDVNQSFVGGIFRFFFGQTQRGIGSNIGVATFTNFGTIGKTSSKNQAIYIQDSWQPFSRLTINGGFRIEKEDVPSFSATGIPLEFDWEDKPAPRIGGAFDVFGDGKTKVFASFGWFYDRFKYELPRGLFGGDTFLRTFVPIVSTDINTYTEQSITSDPNGITLNFRVPSNDPNDNRIDPDLKAARVTEITVGVEHQLFADWIVRGRYTRKKLDRTIEDTGFFDDAGNENFFISNPGLGIVSQPFASGLPATPKAERVYDAVEVGVDKRFSDNYFFNATYTYSRLFGNYSGLASSDERGRSSPNVNRFFDLPFLGFDLDGNPNNGELATDRPHVFKLFGSYSFDWFKSEKHSTSFNGAFIGQSGTPQSTQVSFFNANTFVNGRGDLGRSDTFTQTDVGVIHNFKLGADGRSTLSFEVNIINLFDEDNVTELFTVLSSGSLSGQNQGIDLFSNCPGGTCDELNAIRAIFNGGIRDQVVNLLNNDVQIAPNVTDSLTADGRFGADRSFQGPRQVRFGVRFTF